MEKPDYYRQCIISARCSDWDEREVDAKFIAFLVPAHLEYIAGYFWIDIPEHWEVWNDRFGANETLDSHWIVTKWEYIFKS